MNNETLRREVKLFAIIADNYFRKKRHLTCLTVLRHKEKLSFFQEFLNNFGNLRAVFRGIFRTLSNSQDEAFCENS